LIGDDCLDGSDGYASTSNAAVGDAIVANGADSFLNVMLLLHLSTMAVKVDLLPAMVVSVTMLLMMLLMLVMANHFELEMMSHFEKMLLILLLMLLIMMEEIVFLFDPVVSVMRHR